VVVSETRILMTWPGTTGIGNLALMMPLMNAPIADFKLPDWHTISNVPPDRFSAELSTNTFSERARLTEVHVMEGTVKVPAALVTAPEMGLTLKPAKTSLEVFEVDMVAADASDGISAPMSKNSIMTSETLFTTPPIGSTVASMVTASVWGVQTLGEGLSEMFGLGNGIPTVSLRPLALWKPDQYRTIKLVRARDGP
jgi:hypothetical protein